MRKVTVVAAGLAACLLASGANAAYTYQFTAHSAYGSPFGSFTYTSSDLITSSRSVAASDLDSCTVTSDPSLVCTNEQFATPYIGYDSIGFGSNGSGGITTVYYFDYGAFAALGTHETVLFGSNQAATITVAEAGSPAPEPASWAMMLAGFGAIGGAMRRRRSTAVSFG